MPTKKLRDPEENQKIGAKLRSIRLAQGRGLMDVATAVKISYQQLQKYETGENGMSLVAAQKITQELGVTPCTLLGCCQEAAE